MTHKSKQYEEIRQFTNDLTKEFGHLLTLEDVCHVLGFTNRKSAAAWIKEQTGRKIIAAVNINGRDKWMAKEIAKAIILAKITGAA